MRESGMRANFRKRPAACAGFTLIEVLITVVILSTGLVLILQGLHGVLHVWDATVIRTRSLMRAQEQLAQARLAVQRREPPRSIPGLVVADTVSGHPGLFRVTYTGGAGTNDRELETLLYLAPAREEP